MIRVHYHYRGQGVFSGLVEYLLQRDGCVVIEDIRARWLKRRLAESPLWILQRMRSHDDPEKEDCPRFARFVMNDPFTLF